MKSTVENINSVQRRLSIEISQETVREEFEKVYQRIQKKAQIQGFRPGKAPINVIKRLYRDSVSSEVGESLIKEYLYNAIETEKIRPVALPVIEKLDRPDPEKTFSFSALIDVMPDIAISDYKNLSVTCEKFEVSEDSLKRELDSLRRMHAKTRESAVDAVAAKGMMAVVSHTAESEGKVLGDMKAENLSVELGKNQLFPDLENAIVGMKSGEEKDVPINLPADFTDKTLAGKNLLFHVRLNSLKDIILPELDDEFAKDLNAGSFVELNEKIKKNLDDYSVKLRRNRLEHLLLEQISEKHPFEVPPSLVDEVIDEIIREEASKWGDQVDVKKLIADTEYRKTVLPTAKRRVINSLILAQIAKAENITASDEEIKKSYEETYKFSKEQEKKFGQKKLDLFERNVKSRLKEILTFDKVMNFLIQSAVIIDKPTKI